MSAKNPDGNSATSVKKARKPKHMYSSDDSDLIQDCVDQGMVYKAIRRKFTTDRKRGRKDWSIGGEAKVATKLKSGGA